MNVCAKVLDTWEHVTCPTRVFKYNQMGVTQIYKIDYFETFSLVAMMNSIIVCSLLLLIKIENYFRSYTEIL